jgi:transcriptional regulator with XRE-family HTH domain
MAELEARWHDLGEFIREQRKVGHLSLRKLSDMAGISNPYLSQIERGLRKPSAEILQQIARALEISSETLYIRAGILEPREGDTDLITEIRRDVWLSEEQKKTLVQIYESFRSERRAAGFEPELAGQGSFEDGAAEAPAPARAVPLAVVADPPAGAAGKGDADDPESEALAGR